MRFDSETSCKSIDLTQTSLYFCCGLKPSCGLKELYIAFLILTVGKRTLSLELSNFTCLS